MKALKNKFAILIITIIGLNLQAQELQLDTKNSSLSWTGKAALNSYSLTGSLEAQKGYITVKDNVITNLIVTVNMKSLDHDNADLKKHLRSNDFFDVKKFTKATFKLTRPIKIENVRVELVGKMTIKNKTIEEVILANIQTKNDQVSLTFSSVLNRVEYGITFNSLSIFKKMKENAIADDFKLGGRLVFNNEKD